MTDQMQANGYTGQDAEQLLKTYAEEAEKEAESAEQTADETAAENTAEDTDADGIAAEDTAAAPDTDTADTEEAPASANDDFVVEITVEDDPAPAPEEAENAEPAVPQTQKTPKSRKNGILIGIGASLLAVTAVTATLLLGRKSRHKPKK